MLTNTSKVKEIEPSRQLTYYTLLSTANFDSLGYLAPPQFSLSTCSRGESLEISGSDIS